MPPEFSEDRSETSVKATNTGESSPGIKFSDTATLEKTCLELFYGVSVELSGRYSSVVFYNDQHLEPIRGRTFHDVHAFFELMDGTYFHLRAYASHMADHPETAQQKGVFLTAYHKDGIHLKGGSHAIRQDWYAADPTSLAQDILSQTSLFSG